MNLYKGRVPGKAILPGSEDLTAEDMRCKGCLSDDVFMYCRQCPIKDCTKEKDYAGCHQCNEFSCHYVIENFPVAVGKKVIFRAIPHWKEAGTEKFIPDETARYVCRTSTRESDKRISA